MEAKLRCVAVICFTCVLLVGCGTTHQASTEWEYKTVRLTHGQPDFEAALNTAAKGGWKLVTIRPDGTGYDLYYFERQRN